MLDDVYELFSKEEIFFQQLFWKSEISEISEKLCHSENLTLWKSENYEKLCHSENLKFKKSDNSEILKV